MKVPMQWLRQYTNVNVSDQDFEEQMIMHGTGVEGIEDQKKAFDHVVVGRILSVSKHENSDHMVICQVDVGEEEPIQIVTGAPNVHEGDEVPVAKIGAHLPGGIVIKKGKLRGVDSFGMCCSGPELGVPEYLYPSVGDKGLLIFQEEYAPGTDVHSILGVDDSIVDFEILANRPDCLSVWGVAREASVVFDTPFTLPNLDVITVPGKMEDFVKVEVNDSELCPRYVARVVKNVKVGPSPMWLRKALHGAGIRSINNIVDITNYVMVETGHPMHAFDLDKVRNRHIIVRRALKDETITTLDGKERALTENMLMIADQENATGIAGVMGGEESEITEDTKTVMFEIASFDRTNTRLTTRALGLRTEASGRFERGVCAATCRQAADRACALVNMLEAGDVIDDVYDFYPNPKPVSKVKASVASINRRIGMEIPAEEMVRILKALEMEVTLEEDLLTVVPPAYREDIEIEADISEEVLRIYGYEHIGSTLLRGETSPGQRNENMKRTDRIGRFLADRGLYEIYNYSFFSPKQLDKLCLNEGDLRTKPLKIRNPLGEDTSVMRTTLVPDMLKTLSLNQNRNTPRAMLFEKAPVFDANGRKDGELPKEIPMLCGGAYGDPDDFYHIRDMILDVLRQFGVEAGIQKVAEPYHHPGRAAVLTAENGTVLCRIGEIHPEVQKSFELSQRTVVAELDLQALASVEKPMAHVHEMPRFPAVTRDLALVMKESTAVGTVLELIRKTGGAYLEDAAVFDIYRGAQMLPGMKSVAFTLSFRDREKTLSDEVVNPLMQKIMDACRVECGAILR